MDGKEVVELRRDLHLTLQSFADKLGVSLHEVWRWENGKAKPSQMAQKLLEQLKKDISPATE